jgi:hypothetical protein
MWNGQQQCRLYLICEKVVKVGWKRCILPEQATTTQIYLTSESLSKKIEKKKSEKVEKSWTSVKVGWKRRILPEFVIRNEQ